MVPSRVRLVQGRAQPEEDFVENMRGIQRVRHRGKRRTEEEPCVHVDNDERNGIIFMVYVDDMSVGYRDINRVNERKKIFSNERSK